MTAHFANANSLLRWEHSPVTWAVLEPPSGLALREATATAYWAFQDWAAACGLRFARLHHPSEQANILITSNDLHGRTLAFSEKPGPPQIYIRFNARLRWTNNPQEEKAIWFRRVLLHEIGHALGVVDHLPPPALMSAEYTVVGLKAPELTPADIAEAVARYGPPRQEV